MIDAVSVEQHLRSGRLAYEAGMTAEREACAKLCDDMAASPALSDLEKYRTQFIADAIRARGNT